MEMRTIFFLAIMCCLAFASINPKLELANYTVSENPAQPGHSVVLTLHYENVEFANCAEHVSVQIVTSYPVSVQGPDTVYLDTLCMGDPPEKGTVSFVLPIDPFAQSGTFPVSALATYEKNFDKFSTPNTINMRVYGTPSVTASVTSSDPVDIYPGDQAKIGVTFANNGTGRVESARATFNASPGIEVKWAGENQDIGEILARGSSSAFFTIEAGKNISPGVYHLTAKLDYLSENKTPGSATFTFDIPVKEKAEFEAGVDGLQPLFAGEDRVVSISLKNSGTQEARKLKVRLRPLFPFSTDGTVRYVDSLKPGEEVKLDYLVHVDKDGTAGDQISGLLIDFEDPQGKKFSDSADFSLPVKVKSMVDVILGYWYVFAIVALFIVYKVLMGVFKFIKKQWDKEKT